MEGNAPAPSNHNFVIPGVNAPDTPHCPCCGTALDVIIQGSKPRRINGTTQFTDSYELWTCWNEVCAAYGITGAERNYTALLRTHGVLS